MKKNNTGTKGSVSRHKQTEEALRQSEEKYRLLADHIKDEYVFIMDLNLRWTYASPSAEKLLGYTLRELQELPLDKLLAPTCFQTAMDTFAMEMSKASVATPPPDYKINLELECYCKDVRILWIDSTFSFIQDDKGNLLSILGEGRDITERKRIEDDLRKSEEKYRNILENIQEGYFEVDLAGNYTYFNDSLCKIHGYPREELLGMNNRQYTDKETAKKVYQAFNRVYKTGEPLPEIDWQIKTKEGNKRYIEASVSLLKDSSGKPTGFRGILRDITERKRTDDKLQKTLESLKKAIGTTIQVLVSALESRDPYTAGHQSRTADLACAIAQEMRLPQNIIEGIRMAGAIHDIGKLSIPAEILTKPTKLTNIEFTLIKEHAQSGYEMLKDVESPWPLAEIVHQHHERMDGSGYPRKLKGDEIILEARIMAVADVVEAMASHRPYRPSLGIKAALEEIEKNKGILYDDAVANACLKLFREKSYQLT